MAAILDSVSSGTSGASASSISFNHTLGSIGGTGQIFVGVESEDTGTGQTTQRVTGITYNGIAMTLVAGNENLTAHSESVTLYVLRGSSIPAPGTYSVVVTMSGTHESRIAACASFKGLKDQAAEATATTNAQGTTPLATNITTLTRDALVLAVYGSQNNFTPSFSTGETTLLITTVGSTEDTSFAFGYKTVTLPALTSTSVSIVNPEAEALVLAAFELAPSGMLASEI